MQALATWVLVTVISSTGQITVSQKMTDLATCSGLRAAAIMMGSTAAANAAQCVQLVVSK